MKFLNLEIDDVIFQEFKKKFFFKNFFFRQFGPLENNLNFLVV